MEKHLVIEADWAKEGLAIVTEEWYKKHKIDNKVICGGSFESCFKSKRNILKSKPAIAVN